ncbi:KICSTOR complex protein kaptin [Leptinotarsa decemlineata]|uniref:KICSTOR complex protein kaptin n=1 Tax=Leptinotarsa decemlineata TaxID=7539 RepID=UPI003D306326
MTLQHGKMEHFKDVHFFYTPSQGNIYTMTDIQLVNGSTKLLVASLKREIFCFDFQESSSGLLIPTTKEVSFTYIPNGAEIISIDAFNKSTNSNEFVIGITIIKNSNDSEGHLETYLNIYAGEETEDFNIENIAQSCLNVELNFIPYKLFHTYLVTFEDNAMVNKEIVFVLSGSDNQIHIFRENTTDHTYKEIENKDHFPEFSKTPSPVVWIDIYYSDDFKERITSFACECGYVKLLKVDVVSNKLVYNFSTRFGNYISKVYIFPEFNSVTDYSFEKSTFLRELDIKSRGTSKKLNLVVVNTILPAVIFHDVLEFGLSNYATLPRIDSTSVLSSCEVADIDFDGQKEILIGTSGEKIMMYKKDKKGNWCLEELKKISAPVLGLKYIDITGDGVKDLVILSMRGVHVLQHDSSRLQTILDKKIQNLALPNISEVIS